jgi:3'-phosphoadenosine 5'-phosphosulfate sulfotransferase (PAPS reductase)/FAD synthetase
MTTFYDWSGGMESSAMLVVDIARIKEVQAIVRWVDTGKQFPEIYESKLQIEQNLDIEIFTVPNRITFDEYLFERGGMLRKGMNDCSRRMKRGNLARHMKTFDRPYEINLGYNARETERADEFIDRNERDWCHWRFPLIEARVTRERTWDIARAAGFSVLVGMYEKMGRMDCYFCPNQKPSQALAVFDNYPQLAADWIAAEERKGHSFMPMPLKILVENRNRDGIQLAFPETGCACFGGTDDVFADDSEVA